MKGTKPPWTIVTGFKVPNPPSPFLNKSKHQQHGKSGIQGAYGQENPPSHPVPDQVGFGHTHLLYNFYFLLARDNMKPHRCLTQKSSDYTESIN